MGYDYTPLDRQLCFPLYACSRRMVKAYTPYLDRLGLTYTQFITMTVLWEEDNVSVKELGKRLCLDSGTLTPLLKKMERLGLVTRRRDKTDERCVIIGLTVKGKELQKHAADIPEKVSDCLCLEQDEKEELYRLLYKMLDYEDA